MKLTNNHRYLAAFAVLALNCQVHAANTGINTLSPKSQLSVNGNFAVGTTYAAGFAAPAGGAIIETSLSVGYPNFTPVFSGTQGAAINGDVGVYTSSPRFPIDIQGSRIGTVPPGGIGQMAASNPYFAGAAGGIPSLPTSLYAQASIICNATINSVQNNVTASDQRLKNILGESNHVEDLATLKKIQVTNYTMKDDLKFGTTVQKKVIAQQVEGVYPAAVKLMNSDSPISYIPDVFAAPAKTDKTGGRLTLTMTKDHGLKAGDRVQFFFKEADSQREAHATVAGVDGLNFTVETLDNPSYTGQPLFVYGKQVNDLRGVDYDALSMLNVSATQELAKKVEALEAENAELKKLAAEVQEMKAALVAMQAAKGDKLETVSLAK
jgi:hypothetical protein